MKKRFRYPRSSCAQSMSWFAVIAAGMMLTAPACFASTAANSIRQYLITDKAREIALARSAAPASLSAHATILVLERRGYVTAIRGSNGFVCLVARSWDNATNASSARFWDPKFRAPYCFNPAAVRTVLSRYLMRTHWVIAGASETAIGAREKAAWSAGEIKAPEPGAMSYMMSAKGRGIGGGAGPWRPHLMFYFPRAKAPNWGANLPGNPVSGAAEEDIAVLFVLVPVWSNGTPAPAYR